MSVKKQKIQKTIVKKPKFNFSQDDRYEQKKNFFSGLRIHDEPFPEDASADDLDEYFKEFSSMSELFAIRLFVYKNNPNNIGFQIFIEDDGNFYLWDKWTTASICWLYDLQNIINETVYMLMLDGRKRIIDNVFPAVAQLNEAISFKTEREKL